MPRGDKIMFKYTGDGSEFHNGVPARDILESDLDALTDEQKVTLAGSAVYSARNDADEVAAAAAKRVEKEQALEIGQTTSAGAHSAASKLASDTLPVVSAPAPAKDGEKKA
jgi:uncharacterized protein (UPF0254 family)